MSIHAPSTKSGGGLRLHARVAATAGRFLLRLPTAGRRIWPTGRGSGHRSLSPHHRSLPPPSPDRRPAPPPPPFDRRPPDLAYRVWIQPPRPLSPPPAASSSASRSPDTVASPHLPTIGHWIWATERGSDHHGLSPAPPPATSSSACRPPDAAASHA
ncbi:Os11g0570600 [Oryza sativa Japonica Group]|uniref:Os11g0570600 protein n=1 Tax=Oryza sativa subsp. japonica TaxID=39947 RepID=A0A0P0Y496_ORYSJ|nr:hypothetical protein DAI22_11g172300 [Oryza sativa Japonica Group]BAT14524.1 Os11g0570600 [Oryza sativa Japonica Group]